MNIYLIIIEGNHCGNRSDGSICHGNYIIIFYSYTYNPQAYFNIDSQVISYGEIVCEGTNFLSININSRYYVSPKINPITQLFL